jgi:uncharacterized protein
MIDFEDFVLAKEYIEKGKENELYDYLFENGFFERAELPKTMEGRKHSPTEVYLSLTSGCNFACTYCYARAGETNEVLSWDKIVQSIDQVYRNARNNQEKEIEVTFHGTGEATVRWETLVDAVKYTLQKLPQGWHVYFSLVTNSALLDDEKVKFLKDNDFDVTVSMDGLEKWQNLQRPYRDGRGTFKDVVSAIRLLVKYDVDFGIRSTITGLNQGEMIEFVRFCAELGCKKIYLVPVSIAGRGESGTLQVDAESFIKDYVYLLDVSEEWGIEVHTPSDDISRSSAGFCDADGSIFAVLPDGSISSCTRVTREEDPLSDMFFIGEVKDEGITLFLKKIEKLRELNVYSFKECEGCFAKFVCSGGCHADRFSQGISEEACMITKFVVWSNLLKALS